MPRYKIKSTRVVNGNILQLTLQPKHNRDKINFVAGQYASIRFKIGGRPSPMRSFSIVSSPINNTELRFAIRIDGEFTTTLSGLQVGTSIFVRGPFGNFVIDEHYDRNIIMLAGGIGITPFISMLSEAAELKRPNRLILLHSNQSQNNIPFKDDIVELERRNSNFKAAFFVTKGSIDCLPNYRVVQGRINQDIISQVTGTQYNRFTFFICGPQNFISGMKDILRSNGTNPDRIVTEEFAPSNQLSSALLPKDKASRWTYALSGFSLVIGILFIMGLDLVRAVPRIQLADAQQSSNSNQAQTATTPAATTPTPTPAPVTQTATTPAATTPTPTPAPVTQTTYVAPVTKLS
jgi:ferredoxin-NADP reductase